MENLKEINKGDYFEYTYHGNLYIAYCSRDNDDNEFNEAEDLWCFSIDGEMCDDFFPNHPDNTTGADEIKVLKVYTKNEFKIKYPELMI